MSEQKKKFKETKLGIWLKQKSPTILKAAGELLPDAGILELIANLINDSKDLSPEEKLQARNHLKEMYELEVKDRDSARNREIEIKKTGQQDWMMTITGIVGLLSFIFVVYAVVYEPLVTNNDLFVHLMGMIEGVVISNIFAYYYGTSAQNKK